MNAIDALSGLLLVAGGLLALVAGVGVLRLPDVYARMHAATKPATLGLLLLAMGAALAVDQWGESITLALVVALQFLTAPAGAHMVARSAAAAGLARSTLVVDDLPHDDADPDGEDVG